MAANFRTARFSRSLSVHNVATRCREFPDGYTSYQTQTAIRVYPAADSFEINTFTYLVDQEIGLDADFALRFDFTQDVISKKGIRKFRKELAAEADANITDELDAEDYAEIGAESRQLRAAVKSAPAARGMRVAAIFSFAHQNREMLDEFVDAVMAFCPNDFCELSICSTGRSTPEPKSIRAPYVAQHVIPPVHWKLCQDASGAKPKFCLMYTAAASATC